MTKREKKALKELELYIKQDLFYSEEEKPKTDFEIFCYEHCEDIDIALKIIEKQKEEIKKKDKTIDEMAEQLAKPAKRNYKY